MAWPTRYREKNPAWKGGRFRYVLGYVGIRVEGKYIYEHRLVMEKHLGRPLRKGEVIHHINHKRDDNRIENLQLISSQAEHRKSHKKFFKCSIDNCQYRYTDKMGRFCMHHWYKHYKKKL